jgi:hypothetical protein
MEHARVAYYWLAELVQDPTRSGWGPDFPRNTAFGLLAGCQSVRWGIYRATLSLSDAAAHRIKPLDDELVSLIRSGERYPPALALARDHVDRLFDKTAPSPAELCGAYQEALLHHLSAQSTAPFVLARSTHEEFGYRSRGDWYWVLRVNPGPPASVEWVSDDYCIYRRDPLATFALAPEQIQRLTPGF